MNDNELFELCKSVYEATGWGDTLQSFYKDTSTNSPLIVTETYRLGGQRLFMICPLYTSDYLLEKLLDNRTGNEFSMGYNDSSCTWHFQWGNRGAGYMVDGIGKSYEAPIEADTPLKALLKLALELHKKGLLDAKDNLDKD